MGYIFRTLSWGAPCPIAIISFRYKWVLVSWGSPSGQTLWPQEFGQALGRSYTFLFFLFPHHHPVWALVPWMSLTHCKSATLWLLCGVGSQIRLLCCQVGAAEVHTITGLEGSLLVIECLSHLYKLQPTNFLAWRETSYLPRRFILTQTAPTGGKFFLISTQCWWVSRIE